MRINDAGLRAVYRSVPPGQPLGQAEVNRLIRSAMDGKGLSATEKADFRRLLASDQVKGFPRLALQMYADYGATYRASLDQNAGSGTLWKVQGQGQGGWFLHGAGSVQPVDTLQVSRLMKLGGRTDPALVP